MCASAKGAVGNRTVRISAHTIFVNSVIKITTYFGEHFTNRLNVFWITVQRLQTSVDRRNSVCGTTVTLFAQNR